MNDAADIMLRFFSRKAGGLYGIWIAETGQFWRTSLFEVMLGYNRVM
jgi:hypothetical protein